MNVHVILNSDWAVMMIIPEVTVVDTLYIWQNEHGITWQVLEGSLHSMLQAMNNYFKQLFLQNKQQVLDKSKIKVPLNSNCHTSVSNCQDTHVCQCNISVGEKCNQVLTKFIWYFGGTQFKSHFWMQIIFNYTCSGVLSKIRLSCSFRLLSWSASNTYILVSWLELAFSWKGYNYCWSYVCSVYLVKNKTENVCRM
jgi:hypothetical protein